MDPSPAVTFESVSDMSTLSTISDDRVMAPMTEGDPHGLRRRIAALGLMNKDVAKALDLSLNTITRALNSEKRSTSRPRIVAYLNEIERERGIVPAQSPGQMTPTVRRLAQVIGNAELHDIRIEYSSDGRTQRLVANLGDPTLTPEEMTIALQEWRRERDQ